MMIDLRARQAGSLFSLGIDEDPPLAIRPSYPRGGFVATMARVWAGLLPDPAAGYAPLLARPRRAALPNRAEQP
jgi:hypothetical protein